MKKLCQFSSRNMKDVTAFTARRVHARVATCSLLRAYVHITSPWVRAFTLHVHLCMQYLCTTVMSSALFSNCPTNVCSKYLFQVVFHCSWFVRPLGCVTAAGESCRYFWRRRSGNRKGLPMKNWSDIRADMSEHACRGEVEGRRGEVCNVRKPRGWRVVNE